MPPMSIALPPAIALFTKISPEANDANASLADKPITILSTTGLPKNSYLPISAFFKEPVGQDEQNLYFHFYAPLHDIREMQIVQKEADSKTFKAMIPSQGKNEPLKEWARRIYLCKLSLMSFPKKGKTTQAQKEQATSIVNEMLDPLPGPLLVVKVGKLTYHNSLELARMKNSICGKLGSPLTLKQYLQDLILNAFAKNPQKKWMIRYLEEFLQKFEVKVHELDLIVYYEKIEKTKMDSEEKNFLLSLICKCAKNDPRQEILEAFLKKYGDKQALDSIHSLTKLSYMLDKLAPGPGALLPLQNYFKNEFALFFKRVALFIYVYFPQIYLKLNTRIKVLSIFPPKTKGFANEEIDIRSLDKLDQGICSHPPISPTGSDELKRTASFTLKRQKSSPRCMNQQGLFSFLEDVEEEEGIVFEKMETSIRWESSRQVLSLSFSHSTKEENPFEYQVFQFIIGLLLAQGNSPEEATLEARKLIFFLPSPLFSKQEYACTIDRKF
jgi:hypothetical protein